jgi:hypothetical protein
MTAHDQTDGALHTVYPLSSLLIYNGATLLHYLLGGLGLALAYGASWPGWLLAALYLLFAFGQMYLWMPLKVCPNCVYYRLAGSRCVSGLNLVSRRIARAGDAGDLAARAEGLLCPNNLYLAALVLPVVLILPGLVLSFSLLLLAIWLAVLALLLLRFFVLFPKVACGHCQARDGCPNAQAMGLAEET